VRQIICTVTNLSYYITITTYKVGIKYTALVKFIFLHVPATKVTWPYLRHSSRPRLMRPMHLVSHVFVRPTYFAIGIPPDSCYYFHRCYQASCEINPTCTQESYHGDVIPRRTMTV